MTTVVSLSLLAYFDTSVLYGDDNATPTSVAVDVLVEDGTETYCWQPLSIDAFVSGTTLEYRALADTTRAVATQIDEASAVHFSGDADVVIRAADPGHPAKPSDHPACHRLATTRDAVTDVPVVTYRAIPRDRNRRAHRLAREGHESYGE